MSCEYSVVVKYNYTCIKFVCKWC